MESGIWKRNHVNRNRNGNGICERKSQAIDLEKNISNDNKNKWINLNLMEVGRSIDYEQSLFFLGPSSKLPETRKLPRAWLKAREGRGSSHERSITVHNRSSTSIWDCIPSLDDHFITVTTMEELSWLRRPRGCRCMNRDMISRHSFLQLFCVASYRRSNCITVFIVCMFDQTKPVGEINQVNKIFALLCDAH